MSLTPANIRETFYNSIEDQKLSGIKTDRINFIRGCKDVQVAQVPLAMIVIITNSFTVENGIGLIGENYGQSKVLYRTLNRY